MLELSFGTFLLPLTSVINSLSPVIYPVYLVILNREKIKSKKTLLMILGIITLSALITTIFMYCASYEDVTTSALLGISFLIKELVFFAVSYCILNLCFRHRETEKTEDMVKGD